MYFILIKYIQNYTLIFKFYYDLIKVYHECLNNFPTNKTITSECKEGRSYRSMLKQMRSALLELKVGSK